MNIQIIGTKKCNETRKAERFFKERRISFHFRDLSEKGIFTSGLEGSEGPRKDNSTNLSTKDQYVQITDQELDALEVSCCPLFHNFQYPPQSFNLKAGRR
jgi:hypothetical protein